MKFQFSIRDLLILIAFLALAAGWWMDHQRINKMTVQQWEFKTVWVTSDAALSALGNQGWETCGITGFASGTGSSFQELVLLKRPKQ